MTNKAKNYYTSSEREFNTTFGGYVYNDDFEYASIATIANRIITDRKFDEKCKKNIEQRNRQREYKKEMGKHE